MSYYGEEEDQAPPDPRPMPIRMNLAVHEFMSNPPRGNPEWELLYRKYPVLNHPALAHSYIASQAEAEAIVGKLCHAVDMEYGSGKRMHTLAELGELETVKAIIRLKVFGSIGGFNRVQANATTINQNQRVTAEPRRNSPLARLPVVGRMFRG